MKKKIIVLILIIGLMGAGAYYYYMGVLESQAIARAIEAPMMQSIQLSKGNAMQSIETTGQIQSVDQRIVISKLSGEINESFVSIGDSVKAGDAIISLDVFDVNLSIQEKKNTIQNIQSQIEDLYREKDTSLEISMNNAKIGYDNAKETYDKNLQLFESGAISQQELEASKHDMDKDYNSYATAKLNYDSYDYKSEINQLKASLTLEKSRLEDLENNLSRHNITAPISGHITSIFVDTGDSLNQGAAIVEIQNLNQLEIITEISEYDIATIQIGQMVMIVPYGDESKRYKGTVSKIYPTADISGSDVTVKVIVDINNEDIFLKPNYTTTLEIITDSKKDAFMVPYDAITTTPKGTFVNFGINGLDPIQVETGIESDMFIEIISEELTEGMDIVFTTELQMLDRTNGGGMKIPGGMPLGGAAGGKRK